MIDREGRPLTDPKRSDEGMLLPLGGMEAGFKGYGLSLVIGLLAGTLNQAADRFCTSSESAPRRTWM